MKYSFNQLLQEIANGKRQITIKFPELDIPIKAIITDINLINPDWKPFKVNIITKGLQIKDYRWVEHDFVGEVKEEYQRPYKEDWIKVEFITDIDFEEGCQTSWLALVNKDGAHTKETAPTLFTKNKII